jgi:hypothetical protein
VCEFGWDLSDWIESGHFTWKAQMGAGPNRPDFYQ